MVGVNRKTQKKREPKEGGGFVLLAIQTMDEMDRLLTIRGRRQNITTKNRRNFLFG